MIYKRGNTFSEIITKKTVYVVWEGELSRLIGKHYGKPYRIQQQGDMMSNDSYFTVEVGPEMEFDLWSVRKFIEGWDGYAPLEDADAAAVAAIAAWKESECPEEHKLWDGGRPAEIQENGYTYPEELWWEREGYFDYNVLLWDLNRQGLIPTGDYLVEVMW